MSNSSATSLGQLVVALTGYNADYKKMWDDSQAATKIATDNIKAQVDKAMEALKQRQKEAATVVKTANDSIATSSKTSQAAVAAAVTQTNGVVLNAYGQRMKAYYDARNAALSAAATEQQVAQASSQSAKQVALSAAQAQYASNDWKRLKDSLVSVKSEFEEVFHSVTKGARGFGAQGILKSIMMGVGIGSSMQIIDLTLTKWKELFQANAEAAKKFREEIVELDKLFKGLKERQMSQILDTKTPAVQVEAWTRKLEEAKAKVASIQKDLAQANADMAMLSNPESAAKSGQVYRKYDIAPIRGEMVLGEAISTKLIELAKAYVEAGGAVAEYKDKVDAAKKSQDDLVQANLDAWGKQVDHRIGVLKGHLEDQTDEFEELLKASKKTTDEFTKNREEALKLAEHYKNLGDPTRRFRLEIEAVNKLLYDGKLKPVEAAKAIAVLEESMRKATDDGVRPLRGSLDAMFESLDRLNKMKETMTPETYSFERSRVLAPMMEGGQGANRIEVLQQQLAQENSMYSAMMSDKVRIQKLTNDELLAMQKAHGDRQMALNTAIRTSNLQMASTVLDMAGIIASGLEGLAKKGSGAQKAFFIASRAIAIAQAIINTELAATRAMAEGGIFAGIPMATWIRALGYASVGIIAAQSIASFEGGGQMPSGPRTGGIDGRGGKLAVLHPDEKIEDPLNPGSRRGGAPTIIVNNYGNDQVETSVSPDGSLIEFIVARAKKETKAELASDIRRGGDDFSESMQSVFKNLRRGS